MGDVCVSVCVTVLLLWLNCLYFIDFRLFQIVLPVFQSRCAAFVCDLSGTMSIADYIYYMQKCVLCVSLRCRFDPLLHTDGMTRSQHAKYGANTVCVVQLVIQHVHAKYIFLSKYNKEKKKLQFFISLLFLQFSCFGWNLMCHLTPYFTIFIPFYIL